MSSTLSRDQILEEMGISPRWVRRDPATAVRSANLGTAARLPTPEVSVTSAQADPPPLPEKRVAPVLDSRADIAGMNWEDLRQRIKSCQSCNLCTERKQAVPAGRRDPAGRAAARRALHRRPWRRGGSHPHHGHEGPHPHHRPWRFRRASRADRPVRPAAALRPFRPRLPVPRDPFAPSGEARPPFGRPSAEASRAPAVRGAPGARLPRPLGAPARRGPGGTAPS